MIENLLKQIPNFIPNFCDRCGHKHAKNEVEFLNSNPKNIVARLVCKNCGNISLMQINANPEGINAKKTSVFSDISSRSEMKKFSGKSPVNVFEVADIIIAMKNVKKYEDLKKLIYENSSQ